VVAASAATAERRRLGHALSGRLSKGTTTMSTPVRRNETDLAPWSPSAEFDRITQQLSQLFDGTWAQSAPAGREAFTPLADLEETDDAYLLDIEVPGVKKKDIDIEIEGRRIVVRGERKEEKRVGILRRQTRSWGEFRYEVVLPDEADDEHIEANLDDGVLHLRVPKRTAGQQRRRIEVQ
jgi:HSP20 family protein